MALNAAVGISIDHFAKASERDWLDPQTGFLGNFPLDGFLERLSEFDHSPR
jgi:hypothetical protein